MVPQKLSATDLEPQPVEPSNSSTHFAPLPAETLYALLTAEIAGQRQHHDLALAHYLYQAEITQHPQIAERAARIAQYLGHGEALQQALTIWLNNDDNNPTAHLVAAHVAMDQQNFALAIEHLNALYRLTGHSQYDYLAAKAAVLTTAEQQQLLNQLTQQRQQHPQEATLWLATGLLEQFLGHYDSALKDVNQALKLDDSMLSAQLQKARLLALQGKVDQAIKHLDQVQKHHPEHKRTQILRARFLLQQQRHQEALAAFESIHQHYPNDPSVLLSLALLNEELQHYEAARELFYQLLAVQEYTNEAHFYLGRMAETEDLYDFAIEQYSQVGGGNEFLLANMRAALLTLEYYDLDSAKQFLIQQQETYPQYAIALLLVEAEILAKEQQLDLAEQTLTRGLEQQPDNIELRYSRALIAEQQSKLALAEEDLRHILTLEPQNVNALNALGYTLADHNQNLDEALALIQNAYQLSPNNPAIMDSLGWAHFRRGELEQALPFLEQAFALIQDHEIAAHLGELLWLQERHQEAKEVWIKGLEHTPDSRVINETLERLKVDLAP